MKKSLTTAIGILAAGMLLLANAWGQQSAPTSTQTPTTKAQQTSAAKPEVLVLKTQKDKISYAIGINVGTNLHKQSVDVDPAILLEGLKDGIAGSKPLLTEEEARTLLMQLQEDTRKKQAEKAQQMGGANKRSEEHTSEL